MSQHNLEKVFNFLKIAEKLKSTLRYNVTTGGRKESSADHSWRVALMVFVLAEELNLEHLDIEKCIKLALVHDLPEAITGDIDAVLIAEGKASKRDKQKQEINAMQGIKNTLPGQVGAGICDLWQEYERCSTKEARHVKAVDKLETLTQLVEVGYETYDKPEFIANYADKAVRDFPDLKTVLKIIKKKLRAEFGKGGIPWKEEYDKMP